MADESEQFLSVDRKAQLEAQASTFDGKKMCWINDVKQGYIKGEIISTKGEEVTVKTVTGKVNFALNHACHPNSLEATLTLTKGHIRLSQEM